MYSDEQKAQALRIVTDEKNKWEDATVWVTERVAFRMRELIRYCRKNYWGIFDVPIDPNTKREKIWPPLTQTIVNDTVKNVDLDQKNLNFRARNNEGIEITDLTRNYVREGLDSMYFGAILDATEYNLCIDGTAVWKTWEENGEVIRKDIDLLNVYIDPTEESIQKAYRFTERSILTPSQIEAMDGWEDTKEIKGAQNLAKIDGSRGVTSSTTTGYFTDAWETWGKMPKSLITGNKKDTEEIDGHIVVSGIESGDMRVHLIEENTKTDKLGNVLKPYEEAWCLKLANRWYGLGIAERLMHLQEWLNISVNTRINRGIVSQLGLFKMTKGSGVTSQMLKNLVANGVIVVNDIQSFEQMPIQDVPVSAYKDEEIIWDYGRKVSSTYESTTGDALPASQTATATAIQSKSAQTSYQMIRDSIGDFLERWVERHYLPIKAKQLNIGDIIRFSSNDEEYKEIVERAVTALAMKQVDEAYQNGTLPDEQTLTYAMDSARSRLESQPAMFVKSVHKIMTEALDTDFFVTDEKLDVPVTVSNLISTLNLAPEYKDFTIRTVYDLLGLPVPKKSDMSEQQPEQPGMEKMGQETMPQTLQSAITPALTNGYSQ